MIFGSRSYHSLLFSLPEAQVPLDARHAPPTPDVAIAQPKLIHKVL